MIDYCLAGFMSPVYIGTTPQAFLLALPLIAVISIVYKATKMEKLEFVPFVWQVFLLFCSILVFMLLTAIDIFVVIKLTVG